MALLTVLGFSQFGCVELVGALAGAATGQVIGQNTEATLIGTAIGALLGNIVGDNMPGYRAGQPQLINHSISPSSQRLGMYQNGDRVMERYPTYHAQTGQMGCDVIISKKLVNNQWVVTSSEKECRGRSYEQIPR